MVNISALAIKEKAKQLRQKSYLFFVGGVKSQDPHKQEVGARAYDENRAREGEGIEEVPGKSEHRNRYCDSTDPQPWQGIILKSARNIDISYLPSMRP